MKKDERKKIFWEILTVFCAGIIIAFAPLAHTQADNRIVLQIFVSLIVAIIIVIMWEIGREAFRPINNNPFIKVDNNDPHKCITKLSLKNGKLLVELANHFIIDGKCSKCGLELSPEFLKQEILRKDSISLNIKSDE